MPINECQHTHQDALNSAGSVRAHLATTGLAVSAGFSPKTAEQTLERGYPTFFSNLSSHSLIPASCSISASWCSHQSPQ
jgi:hypothetical protein